MLLCALSLVACTSEQEKRENEDRLRESLVANEVYGVTEVILPKAECSDEIVANEGDHFRCTVTAPDRTSVVVKAMQSNDDGDVKVLTKLLNTRRVQGQFDARVSDLVKDNDSVVPSAPVECPSLVAVKPGAHFTCRGVYSFAFAERPTQRFKLIATFTGDRDEFTYTMRLSKRCRPGDCPDQGLIGLDHMDCRSVRPWM